VTERTLIRAARVAVNVRDLARVSGLSEATIYRLRHQSAAVRSAVDEMRSRTGRPHLRDPVFWDTIEAAIDRAALTAGTIRQLAEMVGLGESPLYRWRHQRPRVRRAMAKVRKRR